MDFFYEEFEKSSNYQLGLGLGYEHKSIKSQNHLFIKLSIFLFHSQFHIPQIVTLEGAFSLSPRIRSIVNEWIIECSLNSIFIQQRNNQELFSLNRLSNRTRKNTTEYLQLVCLSSRFENCTSKNDDFICCFHRVFELVCSVGFCAFTIIYSGILSVSSAAHKNINNKKPRYCVPL